MMSEEEIKETHNKQAKFEKYEAMTYVKGSFQKKSQEFFPYLPDTPPPSY